MNTYEEDGHVPAGMVRWASRKALRAMGQEREYLHYNDADQVAALAMWQHRHKGKSYQFKAAYTQVLAWIAEFLREGSRRQGYSDFPEIHGLEDWHDTDIPSSPEEIMILEETDTTDWEYIEFFLFERLLELKKQKSGRSVDACWRDAKILRLTLQGYSVQGITQETGIRPDFITSFRAKARKMLRG